MEKFSFLSWIKSFFGGTVVEQPRIERPMPISKEQVHVLLGGVLGAYQELLALNNKANTKNVESALFKGTAEVKVANTAYLGQVINSLFSLRVSTPFIVKEVVTVGHRFEGGMPSSRQISGFVEEYQGKVDEVVGRVKRYAHKQKENVSKQADAIKKKIAELERYVSLKDQAKVADILKGISGIAQWETSINLKQVFEAGVSIKQLAGFNVAYLSGARRIVLALDAALEATKVPLIKEYSQLDGRPVPNLEGERVMFGEEFYTGALDYGLIAGELLRVRHDSFGGQDSSFEVN